MTRRPAVVLTNSNNRKDKEDKKMKRASKLLSLLLAAVLLGSLLPTAALAASGTESDPIPLKVGQTVQHPSGEEVFYSFTPDEDGVYSIVNEALFGFTLEPVDSSAPLADNGGRGLTGYLHKGNTYVLKGSGNPVWIQVVNEGRVYSKMFDDEYLVWDFDAKTGILTIDPGQGDGEMKIPLLKSPWEPIEAQIEHVVIGEGVTTVGKEAFSGYGDKYGALEDVSFPSTLKSIGEEAFERCPALKEVTFPASLESIDTEAFFLCTGLEYVTFAGATAVGKDAFEYCDALAEVTVAPGMTQFGEDAFFNTPWVRSLAAENKGAAVVNNVLIGAYGAWDKKKGDGILIIPDGVTKIAPAALRGTTLGGQTSSEEGTQVDWYLEEVVIPDSVTEIGNEAFYMCPQLERVTIGNGVTAIPEACFQECGELRTVDFGQNVTTIGDYAFDNCWLPGDLVIPETVTTIGKWAFRLEHVAGGWDWVKTDLDEPDKVYQEKDFSDQSIFLGAAVTSIEEGYWGSFLGWDKEAVPIKGYDGTYAQQWAEDNGFTFESLGAAPTTPTTPTTPETPTTTGAFSDVPANAYYAEAVQWAVNHDPQITNGTGPNTFSPNATCTRGQVVTFLWRAAGCPAHSGESDNFSDVPAGAYYSDAVAWAVEEGITSGTGNGTFSPNAACTRGQVVTFLFRFEGVLPVSGGAPFTDVDGRAYYYDAVAWAVEKNVTQGTSATTFSPDQTCTRGQIVTFLYRYMA